MVICISIDQQIKIIILLESSLQIMEDLHTNGNLVNHMDGVHTVCVSMYCDLVDHDV